MLKRGIAPDTISFNAVIAVFSRGGDGAGAIKWLESLKKNGLVADYRSFDSAIHACLRDLNAQEGDESREDPHEVEEDAF